MDVTDWISIVTAVAALTGAIATALWGREFAAAKDETIKAKDAQIEVLRTFQDQAIQAKNTQIEALRVILEQTTKAKDAQIEAVRQETEILRELTPMKLHERFVSMKKQMEEYNNLLAKQFQEARTIIAEKDTEISRLRYEDKVSDTEIGKLTSEREWLQSDIALLKDRLHGLRETQEALEILTDKRVWTEIETIGKAIVIGMDSRENFEE